MAVLHLDPEYGRELSALATHFWDDTYLPAVKALYNLCELFGDNHIAEEVKTVFMNVQAKYNSEGVEANNAFIKYLGEYTDAAEHLNSMAVDNTVNVSVEGEVKSGQFDAISDL